LPGATIRPSTPITTPMRIAVMMPVIVMSFLQGTIGD
jgi:hypothetical protein